VQLLPLHKDRGYDDISIGFAQGKSQVLVMVDRLGHTTRVTLDKQKENVRIDTDRFSFTPPEGVDVVGE